MKVLIVFIYIRLFSYMFACFRMAAHIVDVVKLRLVNISRMFNTESQKATHTSDNLATTVL